jgi:hypothetical protein
MAEELETRRDALEAALDQLETAEKPAEEPVEEVLEEPIDKEEAFVNYDYRFYLETNRTAIDACYERWDGKTEGDSIIVLAEQGLGDKIQWNRYAVVLKRYIHEFIQEYLQIKIILNILQQFQIWISNPLI